MTETRNNAIRKIGLTLGLALSMSTLVISSSFAYSTRARQMCMGDAFRFCSSEIPNIGRIVACMRRNKANLSHGCRVVMDQEDVPATTTKPVQAAPPEHKPTIAAPVEQPPATKTTPTQTAPVEQKSTTATPVEQPAAAETKPVQAVPAEQKPTIATPVEVKPVEAKSASRGNPAKLAQHKHKHRQPSIEQPFDIERTIDFALPILGILLDW